MKKESMMGAGTNPGNQAGVLREQFRGRGHDFSILTSLAEL